jgi:hypothetical protein
VSSRLVNWSTSERRNGACELLGELTGEAHFSIKREELLGGHPHRDDCDVTISSLPYPSPQEPTFIL